jgi:hypothetical protein
MSKPKIPGLLDGDVILLYPELAVRAGINEAMILQKLHFLVQITRTAKVLDHFIDGKWWVYNTYAEWQEQYFPWLVVGTVKRLFLALEKDGIILSYTPPENHQKKFYTLNYEGWSAWFAQPVTKRDEDNPSQKETGGVTKRDEGASQIVPTPVTKSDALSIYSISETTTETTPEITKTFADAPGGDQLAGDADKPIDADLPKPKRARKPAKVKTLADLAEVPRVIATCAHYIQNGQGITGQAMVRINMAARELYDRFGWQSSPETAAELRSAFAWHCNQPTRPSAPKDAVKMGDMVALYQQSGGSHAQQSSHPSARRAAPDAGRRIGSAAPAHEPATRSPLRDRYAGAVPPDYRTYTDEELDARLNGGKV